MSDGGGGEEGRRERTEAADVRIPDGRVRFLIAKRLTQARRQASSGIRLGSLMDPAEAHGGSRRRGH